MQLTFTPKSFLRGIPPLLFSQLLQELDIAPAFDLTTYRPGLAKDLYEALLDTGHWEALYPYLCTLHLFCNEAGLNCLLDQARFSEEQERDDYPTADTLLAAWETMASFQEKVFWTYLNHRLLVQEAKQWRQLPEGTSRYWRKFSGLPPLPDELTHADNQDALAQALQRYFHTSQGRGRRCQVESYDRNGHVYFFAYLDNYSQQLPIWQADGLDRSHPICPAFEVVFAYERTTNQLDLFHQGKKQEAEAIGSLFVNTLSQTDTPVSLVSNPVFNLEPLKNRAFRFVFNGSSGIESISISRLRLTSTVSPAHQITLSGCSSEQALYDLLDSTFKRTDAGDKLPLSRYVISQVELKARLAPHIQRQQLAFMITTPNGCGLKHDEVGVMLRQVLRASGLVEGESLATPEPETPAPLEAVT